MKLPSATSCVLWATCLSSAVGAEPIGIGTRLEPLLDGHLVEATKGGLTFRMHRPRSREVVFRTDQPWEGNAPYLGNSVFWDGRVFRMYYAGKHGDVSPLQAMAEHNRRQDARDEAAGRKLHPPYLCYAESHDGIHWRRPVLRLHDFDGSRENNILLTPESFPRHNFMPYHSTVFLDRNPECPPEARYKMLMRDFGGWHVSLRGRDRGVISRPGVYLLGSPDGIRFSLLSDDPLVAGFLDSQNVMFYDAAAGTYRIYYRLGADGVRGIATTSSADPLAFPNGENLRYAADAPRDQLYSNAVQPYYRAPHVLVGFPLRYVDRGWTPALLTLGDFEARRQLAGAGPIVRGGTATTDTVLMSSRDGVSFRRHAEAFIRPGRNWLYGDNSVMPGLIETTAEDGESKEMSLFAAEGTRTGGYISFRRHTLRLDGFVSAHALMCGGELITKPLLFEGGSLALNAETSAAGSIQVEIQDAEGSAISGYALNDCPPIACDSTRHVVRWDRRDADLSSLQGRPVRLRFVLRDADLYSLQFVPREPALPAYRGEKLPAFIPAKNPERRRFIVIEDDFFGVPAGRLPTAEDLDPAVRETERVRAFGDEIAHDLEALAQSARSGWEIREDAPNRVQVLVEESETSPRPGRYLRVASVHPQPRRDISAKTSDNRSEPEVIPPSLGGGSGTHGQWGPPKFEATPPGGSAWIVLGDSDYGDTHHSVVRTEVSVRIPTGNRSKIVIEGVDFRAGSWTHLAFGLEFSPDGAVSMVQRATGAAGRGKRLLSNLRLRPNTWQEIVITADLAAGTFDLTIAGVTEWALPTGYSDGYHRLNTIRFTPAGPSTELHLKRVKVEVIP